MKITNHALPDAPIGSLAAFISTGGLQGLAHAVHIGADETISLIEASGLRGRGGAGFPTGRKWRSIQGALSPTDAGYVEAGTKLRIVSEEGSRVVVEPV